MSNHLFMGAINKASNERENPKFADKKNHYMCPSCEKDVIFKKGQIKIPHFAHKASEIKCTFYDKPSETEIHKEAKILMKSLLNNKIIMMFHRNCSSCEHFEIIIINYNENDKAVIEYKFNYNNSNRSADVALVNDNNIKFIFEICHKNKTKECNRPEPWVEIDATNFINKINENSDYNFQCIREHKCNKCIEEEIKYKQMEQERLLKIKQQEIAEQERLLKIKQAKEQAEQERIIRIKQLEDKKETQETKYKYQNEHNYNTNRCFKCGKFGHYTSDCHKERFKLVDVCYNCGEEDHYMKECPKNILKINNENDEEEYHKNIKKINNDNIDFID